MTNLNKNTTQKPIVASFCSTFLKEEMLHIYRQISSIKKFRPHIVCKERINESIFKYENVSILKKKKVNFISRFYLKYLKGAPPLVYRGEYQPLAKILKSNKVDLLHIYFGHTGVHLLPFIKLWDKPVVVSFHGMDVQLRKHDPSYEEKLRELLKVLPLVMVRSNSLKERLIDLGCDEKKIRLNTTGIPFYNFPYKEKKLPKNGAWQIVQSSRLIEKKGIKYSLEAFAGFLKHYPNSIFSIAGEGELKASLEKKAQELNIFDNVKFLGFLNQKELNTFYQKSHIFLHPSIVAKDGNQEGIPNSMLEAMSTGLPVVSTFHGGIPEAVKNDYSGLLVNEKDSKGLLDSLLKLTKPQNNLFKNFSKNASSSVRENFSVESSINKLEKVYFELLKN